jgi:uncharacterized protein YdhG (YjbR/CyaY superfamily)
MKKPKDVDSYIAAQPKDVRIALTDLRKAIRQACPDVEERIGYGMPYYKYHGMLAYFAAFKNHCSLYVMSKPLMKKLSKELEPFDVKGQTVHFTPKNPIPSTLVKKIIKETMKLRDKEKKN